ncbi:MAG: sigma-54-dependent Fis family transcriptional regulator [Saprospiraceae bacterium]|nr:sigma-54-dependent Fis family transcriptional regulator [Candidatus Opimibacter skivensis]MBL0006335.1 sigma-54-dependent Fis family transcriptional regulator [Candidatus Opimibacter skivensis]MBP8085644.1 sigma-54-dependent Fis family transcriptional regulator [Saprospiraceae bacterium]HQW24312.1 sigma-54 dependent transcriptional regulator [Saprospiraceae bacterium]
MSKVLIVDDERSIRHTLRDILEFEKYEVDEACDGMEALVKIKQNPYDVIILDIKMPKMDGMDALDRIQEIARETPVVMISGHASIDTAVEAVKKGAFDFISKPPDLNRLLITLRNAMDKSELITERKVLQTKVSNTRFQPIVGQSKCIGQIMSTIELVAPTDARVLVTGQNGTGKELVAHWIHQKSNRRDHPLIEVNCAAIPSELIESELFGHEKGAFTSAIKTRTGKFELANGGTIFLDEIGDMSLSAQAKVLRALQENKIVRVGGDKQIRVDVRVIAATNKDLRKLIDAGRFREDLYHRLAVIIIDVPPLKERVEDIPMLIQHFCAEICKDYGIPEKQFDAKAIKKLQTLPWTGNIRELKNVVERLIILGGKIISAQDIDRFVLPTAQSSLEMKEVLSRFTDLRDLQRYIEQEYTNYQASIE